MPCSTDHGRFPVAREDLAAVQAQLRWLTLLVEITLGVLLAIVLVLLVAFAYLI